MDRATLASDWFGYGPATRDAGVDLQLEWAQFYQGMADGDGHHSGQYGGQFFLQTRLDLARVGLWNGPSLKAQGLFNHGHGSVSVGKFYTVELPAESHCATVGTRKGSWLVGAFFQQCLLCQEAIDPRRG